MSLTLQALKYMIWLQVMGVSIAVFLAFIEGHQGLFWSMAPYLFIIAILYLFSKGLRQERTWVAALFALYCIFGFLSGVAYGLNVLAVLGLVDAVLSFVALCGIVIWFRSERKASRIAGPA
ncbi:MAG: hypothetical protein ABJL67_01970 [Sulfitobacter sp.]